MKPIVFSSSAIAAYKRCPKSYDLGYERGLEPVTIPEYVEQGASFHALMAMAAKGDYAFPDTGDGMTDVARAYLEHKPLPEGVLMVEEPLYTPLIDGVYLRTTFDLVYERPDGTIVGRDYKTFERAPTLDLDLDFQGRIYISALMLKFPGRPVEFEYEYVRRSVPGTKNSKGYWTERDCYLNFPLVISRREAEDIWRETQWVAEAMLVSRETGRYWRTDLKGSSPFTCGSCFYRDLCKAELEHGQLDEQDLAILAPNRKEPIELPEGVT
jgi:hypothetical protein